MNDRRRTLIGIAAIVVVALIISAIPHGGDFVVVVTAAVQSAFLTAMAFTAWRLYKSQTMWLNALPERDRGVLYAAVAVAVLSVVAVGRFHTIGAAGTLLLIGILGVCGAAVYWVWRESRRYSL